MHKLIRLFLAALVITSLMVGVSFAAESYPDSNCYPPTGGECDGAL